MLLLQCHTTSRGALGFQLFFKRLNGFLISLFSNITRRRWVFPHVLRFGVPRGGEALVVFELAQHCSVTIVPWGGLDPLFYVHSTYLEIGCVGEQY